MSTDSAAAFAEALAKRNQRKAEEENGKNNPSGGGFVDVSFSALIPNVQRVFRLLSYPYDGRTPGATDQGTFCKKIWTSMALNDADGYSRLYGPDPRGDGKNWILYRLMNTVLSYDWDPDMDGGKGGKRYHYQESNKDLFDRIRKNNQLTNKYATGWQFDAVVLFNCIDRSAMDWHKEHKKARVLSKGTWEDKEHKVKFDLGVPDTVYTTIMDDIVSLDGNTDWSAYDVVITRLSEKPWYKAFHPTDDAKRVNDEAKALVVNGPLTEEEKSWELWNFDKIYPISRYKKIMESFGLTFQKVDKVFGKTFYEELKELIEQEEKEISERRAKEKAESGQDTSAPTGAPAARNEEPAPQPAPTPAPSPAPAPAEEARTREPAAAEAPKSSSIPWDKLADGSFNGTVYAGVPLMTEQEKNWVLAVNSDGSFEYSPEAGVLYQSTKSKFFSPERFHVDPLDGRIFPPPAN